MSFTREYAVKATRKPGQCCACKTMIAKGEPAIRWAGLVDGDFQAAAYHPECRTAEIAYNQLIGFDAYDWHNLDELERDDQEWLLAEHPTVAARMRLPK
jgi:hypothetical protein